MRKLVVLAAVLASSMVLPGLTAPASAATSVALRGVVQCPAGQAVTGIYIQSSGGGSGFATYDQNWRRFPNNPHVANFVRPTAMNLPSNVQVHVGCGGTSARWGSNNKSGTLIIRARASREFNLWCTGGGTCAWPNNKSSAPAPPAANPLTAMGYTCECTWYAAERVKTHLGKYPNWRLGNGGTWAANATAVGWTVTQLPRPGSVVVWPARVAGAGSVGHVGWLVQPRINADGTVDLYIQDKNWIGCTVRNGVWVRYNSAMRFIVMPAVNA